jgi:hypothetical protein
LSVIKQHLGGRPTDKSTDFVEGNIITPGGKSEPAWRYRKNSTKLLDNFLDIDRQIKELPKPKPVGDFVPPEPKKVAQRRIPDVKDVGEFEPPEEKPAKLGEVPEKTVMTPEKLKQLKGDALAKASTIVNRFGIYMAAGGIIGGVTELVRTGDPIKAATGAAEGIAVGLGGGAAAPYLMARLLEKPGVVEALTTVTKKDLDRLMKLPPDERAGVESAMKQLAEQAEAKGKLKKPSPWLRILGGKAAVAATKPSTETAPAGESEEEIQKDLDEMNKVAQ